ncbi:MAG: hypothetical protein J6B67_01235, partial [Oscillospiraceae bacterium]|nr:hypothetical protein [Oscillospiraceae bacterium]
TYTDYDGNEVQITGMGLVPYFMWNATDGMYFDVFYGATFVDYVGYVEDKLTMVRPVNGTNYDSYILSQYFDVTIDGAQAPDKQTLSAIAAIKAIPERVSYEQKYIVENARALYSKIGLLEQQALVTNYSDLVSAEQRIIALTPTDEPAEVPDGEPAAEGIHGGIIALIVILCVLVAFAGGIAAYVAVKAKKEQRNGKEVLTELLKKTAELAKKLWAVTVTTARKFAGLCVKLWKKACDLTKKFFAKKEAAGEVTEEVEEAPVEEENLIEETASAEEEPITE